MKSLKFAEWASERKNDIFGFEKKKNKKSTYENDLPIDPIDPELIMKELVELPLGVKRAIWDWHDTIVWGNEETPGSVLVELSPLGSYKAITRKMIMNAEGDKSWICKNVFDFNEDGTDKEEKSLSFMIYEELTKADLDLDSANSNFNDFEKYVIKISSALKLEHPKIMFFDKVKKLNEYYYICTFNYRGQGVEAPGSMRVEQFHVNLNFDKKKGLIRCWGNEVSSPTSGHKWQPQPSEWDEYFAPTQKIEEIAGAIKDMFMTY
jgi:hypothetical protein